MSGNTCKACSKKFTSKHGLDYHILNDACKLTNYVCKFCDKGFTTETNMYRHMRANCKIKKKNDDAKNIIYERLVQLEEDNKLVKKIAQDNKKLKKEMASMRKQIKTTANTNNKMIVNNNNNNNNNNNININNTMITHNNILVAYGKEDFTKIDQKDFLKVLHNGYNSTIKLTEMMHFNPKYPEYHNIYISNMKDKYAMMYDGTNWALTMKENLINKIYDDKKNYIEENLDDFVDSLSISRKKALERWLDTDDDNKRIKEVKDNIKLLLYNSRKLPMDTAEKFNNKLNKKIITMDNT
jgi:hypothetical protein